MVKSFITMMVFLSCSIGFAQGLEGVYQLELEDINGQAISKGTGFLVQPNEAPEAYILTSFHLINAALVEAEKIKIRLKSNEIRYLKIVSYDELNDILVLSASEVKDQPLYFAKNCENNTSVPGYHDGKLLALEVNGFYKTEIPGVNKLPVYLTKGFSGAPVLNSQAGVCGMVVLSSEQNSSSIFVSSALLSKAILTTETSKPYSIRELRMLMGLERIVKAQEDLDLILSKASPETQIVINLLPQDLNSKFVVKNAKNLIIKGSENIKQLIVHQSQNIMIKGINFDRLIINESESITITACVFDKESRSLFLKDSKNLLISKNLFKNIEIGVVLKSTIIELNSLIKENNFEFVANKIINI